jgi:hypothetical protein
MNIMEVCREPISEKANGLTFMASEGQTEE